MTEQRTVADASAAETAVAALAFLAEIALAAGAGAGVKHLITGWSSWPVAILAVIVVVAVWASFMSPKAPRRLPVSGRVALGCLLFVVVGAVLAATNVAAGVALAIAGCAITAVAQPLLSKYQGS